MDEILKSIKTFEDLDAFIECLREALEGKVN